MYATILDLSNNKRNSFINDILNNITANIEILK